MPTTKRSFFHRMLEKDRVGYLFILPSCLVLLVFSLAPLFASFFVSLTDLSVFLGTPNIVGLANFARTFSDTRVWNAFGNTLEYVLYTVPLQMMIALILAYWLYKANWFNAFCRSVFYIPVLCSYTSVGIMFSILLNSTVGYIPYVISLLTGSVPAVFADINLALPVIIFISIWKNFGKTLIILVAGMNDIPSTLYEASAIDGASRFKQFFYITLPNLLPSLNFTLLTTLISAFQVFDVVYVTTSGGPMYSTETMVQYIYLRGFNAPYELGYASALAVELFAVIALLVMLFKGFLERKIQNIY